MKIGNEQNRTLGSYCGTKTGENVTVTGVYAVLTFHSDGVIHDRGYKLIFSFVSQGNVKMLMYCLTNEDKNYSRRFHRPRRHCGLMVSVLHSTLSYTSRSLKLKERNRIPTSGRQTSWLFKGMT